MFDLLQDDGVILVQSRLLGELAVRHAFTGRGGGVSSPPYDTLNMALHVGDAPESVGENRARACRTLGVPFAGMVAGEQVHGAAAYVAGAADVGRGAQTVETAVPATDILLTAAPGLVLTSFYADCVPILLCDPVRRVIASAHAGWRGALAEVGAVAVQAMRAHFHSQPGDIRAVLGPAIGPCCYQVAPAMAADFQRKFGADVAFGRQLDLKLASRRSLERAGVPAAQIHQAPWCTCCHAHLFFSHRASGGRTGRFAALISL